MAFWALAIAGEFNIGYRHVLPALPFLYILGGAGCRLLVDTRIPRLLLAALYAWLAVETLSVAPHYLAYFSQIAGGPDGGYRVLVDSNLDWGQDLPGLVQYVERERIARTGIEGDPFARVNLSWFGAAHPEAYGLSFHPLPGFWRFGGESSAYGFNPYAPAPGTYAISATNLQGVKLADRDMYAWFRAREPDAHVGHSILIYEVRGEPGHEADKAAVLGVPLAELAQEERELLAQVDSIRRYDPQTGVIVPAQAREVWTITTRYPGWGEVVRQGAQVMVVRGSPPSITGATTGHDDGFAGFVAPLDIAIAEPERGVLTVVARWQVEQPPHRAAVSFAHLLDAEGRYVAGWDGLTAPATCWQAGDWIEQRYALSLPQDLPSGAYAVEIGWYDADTGLRWPYMVDGKTVGDRMLVQWKSGRE